MHIIANKTINSRKVRSVLKIIQCHILILTNIFIFSGGTSKVTNTADKTSVKYSDSYVVNVYSQGYKKHKKTFFNWTFFQTFFTDSSYIIEFKREYTSHLDDENMYCFISKPQIRFMRRVPLKHCSRINNFFISFDKPLCFWNVFILSSWAVGIMSLRVFSRIYFQAPRALLSAIVAFLI